VVNPEASEPSWTSVATERAAGPPRRARGGSLKTRQRVINDESKRGAFAPPRDAPSRARTGVEVRPCGLLRKEVIQPQVLLQLPCYDFTPITDHTVGACLPYGLAQRLLVQPAFVM